MPSVVTALEVLVGACPFMDCPSLVRAERKQRCGSWWVVKSNNID